MLQKLSHVTVYCLDHEETKAFYTEKMGFEVRTDITMGSFRWLTVSPPGQDLELVLMKVDAVPLVDDATHAALRSLMKRGVLGPGVFQTADCRATYRELKERGVEFLGEPAERPYGVEVMLKDNSGNVFSVVQPAR